MKLLVLSDSHGNVDNMLRAVELTAPDRIVHLGDGWRDAEELHARYPALPLERVPGNCDYGCRDEAQERILLLGGKRILLCHGHTLRVKSGLLTAYYTAQERQVDALLFGHTHEPYIDERGGTIFLNPGSIGAHYRPTYATLELRDGQCIPATFVLDT